VWMSVEGKFFGKTQERSSVKPEHGPQGSCEEEAGPHSLQSVSEGEAKVSMEPSGEVPRRGVQCGAKAACSWSSARRVKSGSTLKIRTAYVALRSRRTEGKTSELQPDLMSTLWASLWTLSTPREDVVGHLGGILIKSGLRETL
jgi:hypothetical protein